MALIRKLKAALFILAATGTQVLFAADMNMREGVTETSQMAYDLHMLVIYVCIGIGIITFGAMFYSMWAHRREANPTPATFSHSTVVEIIWTAIPLLILVALAVPATKALIIMEDTETDVDMTVLVTGSQWKWHYKYLDGEAKDIEFLSLLSTPREMIENYDGVETEKPEMTYLLEVDKHLVIPTGKKVRFLLTSDDVIHSWWVPDFAVKKDAIPGFINESWALVNQPGIYRGQCTELCGKDHGFMPVVVEVLPEAEFKEWVAAERQAIAQAAADAAAAAARSWSMEQLMAEGEQVYLGKCAVCHMADGTGNPPVFPSMIGSPITTGPIEDHINIVVHGKAGTAMQAFAGQLTDAEIAAVVTYERNAWGNNLGDKVQPADIAKYRNK
jgi:cytochrome c oxidase subunit II